MSIFWCTLIVLGCITFAEIELRDEMIESKTCLSHTDWRVVTESGEQFDEDLSDLAESLVEKTEENGVLRPYYGKGYGQFYIDR